MKEDKKIAAALAKAKLPPQAIQVRNTSIYYSVYEIEFILADKYGMFRRFISYLYYDADG